MKVEVRNKLFSSWRKMKDRCDNKNHKEYHNYGGSGVYYDSHWTVFDEYCKDVQKIPGWNPTDFMKNTIQLDKDYKVIGNKLYSKDTCLWINRKYNMLYQPSRNKPIYAYNPETDKLEYYLSPAWFGKVHGVPSSTCDEYARGNKREVKGYYLWRANQRPPLMYMYVGISKDERLVKNKLSSLCNYFNVDKHLAARCVYSNSQDFHKSHRAQGIVFYKEYMSINAQRLSNVDTSCQDLWKKLVE